LTQAYKNIFPDTTYTSIPAVTMLRSRLSMYLFFVYNNFFFSLLVLLKQLTRGYFVNSPCIWNILCQHIIDIFSYSYIWAMTHCLGMYSDLHLTELWPLTCKYLNSVVSAIRLCHAQKKYHFWQFFFLTPPVCLVR
jgi:hypothetical protein